MSRRVQKVEKELQQVIASFLLSGLKSSLNNIVTVSHVQASPDLRSAKVFVSFMGNEDQTEEDLETLNNQRGMIQQAVHKKVPMKFCPKLKFFLNTGIAHSLKVESILHEISKESSSEEE